MDLNKINDLTGYADGDLFETEDQVKDYFTVQNLDMMFGAGYADNNGITESDLSDMAETILCYKDHCNF